MNAHYRALLLSGCLLAVSLPTLAQDTPADAAPFLASYSLTKTGWGSADRITDPGKVYVVRIDGLLARAIADHMTPTNVIKNGKLVPPAKGFIATFGAGGDSQQIAPKDRFYMHEIETKDDGVQFTLISLDKENVVIKGRSTSSRLRMYIKFAVPKEEMPKLTPDALHAMADAIFLPEGTAALTPNVQLGQTKEDVEKLMGEPTKIVSLGPKEILLYKDLKVVLTDGKVTDAE
jgi:hypothetical protein